MSEVQMVKPDEKIKLVKIKTKRACLVRGKVVEPNQVVEATEAEAAEYCDKPIKGYFRFEGTRRNGTNEKLNEDIYRAERVK